MGETVFRNEALTIGSKASRLAEAQDGSQSRLRDKGPEETMIAPG
jgi:hypothetical protein